MQSVIKCCNAISAVIFETVILETNIKCCNAESSG